jgi:2-furoyl-CoA dehydrogenase large subunit
MSVPACVANAIADALNVKDVQLPATPKRIHALMAGPEVPPTAAAARLAKAETKPAPRDGREITGRGSFDIAAPPEDVWRALLDPDSLHAVIPGCRRLDVVATNAYRAEVSLGVGPVRGRFVAQVRLSDLDAPRSGRLSGTLDGPLGAASGEGQVHLAANENGTRINYDYTVTVSGKVAAVGGRLLDGATQVLMRQFFERLARHAGKPKGTAPPREGFFARLMRALFGGRS